MFLPLLLLLHTHPASDILDIIANKYFRTSGMQRVLTARVVKEGWGEALLYIHLPIQWPSPGERSPPAVDAMCPFCRDDVRMRRHRRCVCCSPNSPAPPEREKEIDREREWDSEWVKGYCSCNKLQSQMHRKQFWRSSPAPNVEFVDGNVVVVVLLVVVAVAVIRVAVVVVVAGWLSVMQI